MVETHDPEKVLDEAERERKKSIENAQEALKFFIEEVDGLIEWEDSELELAEYLDVKQPKAKRALTQIVGDIVDPIQQIGTGQDRYVGVIEFAEFSDAGAYGYTHYSDTHGRRNRVVCAKCVQEKESDSEVAHATQGEGTNAEDATWGQLLNKVTSHYADAHESAPGEISIGASLISGTTMGGNQAWHQGNVTGGSNVSIGSQDVSLLQGSGSGLDADTVDGDDVSDIGGGNGGLRNVFESGEFFVTADSPYTTSVEVLGDGTIYAGIAVTDIQSTVGVRVNGGTQLQTNAESIYGEVSFNGGDDITWFMSPSLTGSVRITAYYGN